MSLVETVYLKLFNSPFIWIEAIQYKNVSNASKLHCPHPVDFFSTDPDALLYRMVYKINLKG